MRNSFNVQPFLHALTSCDCCVEREYFASEDDEDLLVKQLRYYTRFITVCLLLGKRDEVWEHLQKLTELVEEFSKEAQVGALAGCREFV